MHKFLLDAQLPIKLKPLFIELGCECLHTLDLPNGNRTSDQQILELSDADELIVVTKDNDFVDSHLLLNRPRKLLLLSCGNLDNESLKKLLLQYLPILLESFQTNKYIEINKNDIIIHS